MKKLEGFHDEVELQQLLFDGEIDHLSFVQHHSEEMVKEFKVYCARLGLQETDKAASQFMDYKLKEEEMAHNDILD